MASAGRTWPSSQLPAPGPCQDRVNRHHCALRGAGMGTLASAPQLVLAPGCGHAGSSAAVPREALEPRLPLWHSHHVRVFLEAMAFPAVLVEAW